MSDLTGHHLGPYTLEASIGRGGMASVYKAYQPQMKRHVAIKVLPETLATDPTFYARFEREAQTFAQLQHPAILPVHDFGRQGNFSYIVMRYISTGTLADRMKTTPLTYGEITKIMSQITSGLDYAHRRGIIHRDLKPDNIFLDDDGNALLGDFGIAHIMHSPQELTGEAVIGTPAYMSPEQAHAHPIDGRSDIYSLGIILFELFTGQKPYTAHTPMAVIVKHITQPLPPMQPLNPQLEPQLITIVTKATAKEPSERYQSMAALGQALNTTLHPLNPHKQIPITTNTPPKPIPFQPIVPPPSIVAHHHPTTNVPPPTSRPRYLLPLSLLIFLLIGSLLFLGQRYLTTPTTPTPTTINNLIIPPPPTNAPATPTLPPTPIPTPTWLTRTIGQSAANHPLTAYQFGYGPQTILLVTGIHAGYAPGAVTLGHRLVDYYQSNPQTIPDNVSLIIIPTLNPNADLAPGQLAGRLNANGVDLNRNWDCRWQADSEVRGTFITGVGGTAPASEPETTALLQLITESQPTAVIFYTGRAANGLAVPGNCGTRHTPSEQLSNQYGRAANYTLASSDQITNDDITGDASNYLAQTGIPAIFVLLPQYDEADFEANLAGVTAVLNNFNP
ncbi:MAG TPA: protein kinase [Anaerolineae bacterium]|nr:protein kinase [Anaerolineae bacterium]